jgi:hypothetical protein
MQNLLLTSKLLFYRYEKILSIIIYILVMLILNKIMSPTIAECTPPTVHIENEKEILYAHYSTFEKFKEYIDSKVVDDIALILGKYEPISVTYLRTALYTLHSIYDSFPNKPEDTEIISNQFYNSMLVFDKNIVVNILKNMAIINIEKNVEVIYQTIADFLSIEQDISHFGFTDFEMRNIRMINNAIDVPAVLETRIYNYKAPINLAKPWKLPEPTYVPDLLDQLIKDIQTKTGIYQNVCGMHDLPNNIMEKVISDTVTTYHNNPDYWNAYKSCDKDIHDLLKKAITDYIQDYYLQQPYLSKLQTQVYQYTLYYFSREDT